MTSARAMEAGRKFRNYGSLDAVDNGETPNEQEPFITKGESSSRPNWGTPEYYRSASMWSHLVFGWLDELLALGNDVGRLEPEDLDKMPLLPGDDAKFVSEKFDRCWKEEKARVGAGDSDGAPKDGGDNKTPSLARALFRAFGLEFVLAGALKLAHDLLQFVGPNVLNRLIKFLRDEDSSLIEGCYLTAAVVLAQILMSFCLRHYFFRCYRTGLRVRTACIVAIYKKALVISSFERQMRTVGEITNLMAIDAQRLQDTTTFFHAVWYSAVQIILALFFLWQQLGPSCLAGVAVIMISMPLTAKVAAMMGRLQKALMKSRDRRVDTCNEALGAMKVIKLQAWEQSFQDRIRDLREKELSQLLRYLLGRCCNFILWSSVPLLCMLSTFAAYVLSGHDLDVAEALTALVLFDILRFPLFMLPNVINTLVEANVALNRILSFLLSSEHKPVTEGPLKNVGVQFQNATFVYDSKRPATPPFKGKKEDKALAKELSDKKWENELLRAQIADAERKIQELSQVESDRLMEQSSNLLSLCRVDLSFQAPELIAVVGAVGSGKSTLINSILGEVRALAGAVHVKGKVAFYSQNTYMVNDTVRGNICFGNDPSEVNVSRYRAACEACALQKDFSLLPDGDNTIIGERGITLSGGQRARVQLARCVYSDSDILLLDDPLAAVDAHVGKHIFEQCIVNELLLGNGSIWRNTRSSPKKRLIVLATNSLQFLKHPEVSRIVVLKDGCVDQVGTYAELCEHGTFRSFLDSFNETLGSSIVEEESEVVDGDKDGEGETIAPPSLSFLKSLGSSHARRISRRSSAPINLGQILPQSKARRAQSLKLVLASLPAADRSSPLIAAEERAMGHVSRKVYMEWARASGGILIALFIIFSYLAVEGINVLSQWYLTYWSEHGEDIGQLRALAIYAGINFTAIIAMFCRLLLVMLCGIKAARALFSEALRTILGVPMSFFDTTPLGRVVNIFSKDVYTIDEVLPSSFQMYLNTLASVAGVLVVISTVTPLFVLFLLPIIYYYSRQQSFFTQTYRELKRLDSTARSPIYALFNESLDGVATIRAFNIQTYLNESIMSLLDKQQNAYFLTCTANCWLGVRLELAGTLIIAFSCICAIAQHGSQAGNSSYAGLAGLSITFALSITQSLNWSVRMRSDFEANMVAVERVRQYSTLEKEAPQHLSEDSNVDPDWPNKGVIEFKSAKLRYRPGLPLVLKGMSLVIPAQTKLGVVGRTGAGKSTIIVGLLRIVELDSGSIFIDGVDIRSLGLKKLRSNIAVIPQDPTLFSGSIRDNLDPFNEHSDQSLCKVLQRVGLMSEDSTSTSTFQRKASSLGPVTSLSDKVLEGGSNFSVGQRQLLVIARALISKTKIVIMDEATASVDSETDAKIQRLMRNDFKHATTITVAHRLNTIMDSDLILVMDDGRAAEFGSPNTLLKKPSGMFKSLVDTFEREKGHT